MDKKEEKINIKISDERKVIIQENIQKGSIKNEDMNIFFKKTVQNTISAFILSLIIIIINFICNIPLLRLVSKESYGVAKVYFELAFILINYIPRETLRRAAQKFCPDKDPQRENEKFLILSQISYIYFALSTIFGIVLFFCFMIFTDSPKLHENYIQLIVYMSCGLVEMFIEPVILYMNLTMENKFLPKTASSLTRVITNTIFTTFFNMDLWAFTLSRVCGSCVYISYNLFLGLFKYQLNFNNFIPRNFKSIIFDKKTISGINLIYMREILHQFIKLNLLNLVFSKCQDLVLSFLLKSSDEEKSDYSLIKQNYSNVTKFLVEPIVDAFYNLVNRIKYIENKRGSGEYFEKNKINNDEENDDDKEKFIGRYKMEELMENNNATIEISGSEEIKNYSIKEINYDLSIKLLRYFIKIFFLTGILIIPYYILIGTELMGLIFGSRWQTNTIDKIGDCYSYFVVFIGLSDLVKNFGNAVNDEHQMNLSYLSLISNALFLSIFMFILSKWDICGLIISNVLSGVFLINFDLYIIFCGKTKNVNTKIAKNSTIYENVNNFINKCLLSKNSLSITFLSILIGGIIKKLIAPYVSVLILILTIGCVGSINFYFIYKFDYEIFIKDLDEIKSNCIGNE